MKNPASRIAVYFFLLLVPIACVSKEDRIVQRIELIDSTELWLLDSSSFDDVNQVLTLEIRDAETVIQAETIFDVIPWSVDLSTYKLVALECDSGLVAVVKQNCPTVLMAVLDFSQSEFYTYEQPELAVIHRVQKETNIPTLLWRLGDCYRYSVALEFQGTDGAESATGNGSR